MPELNLKTHKITTIYNMRKFPRKSGSFVWETPQISDSSCLYFSRVFFKIYTIYIGFRKPAKKAMTVTFRVEKQAEIFKQVVDNPVILMEKERCDER